MDINILSGNNVAKVSPCLTAATILWAAVLHEVERQDGRGCRRLKKFLRKDPPRFRSADTHIDTVIRRIPNDKWMAKEVALVWQSWHRVVGALAWSGSRNWQTDFSAQEKVAWEFFARLVSVTLIMH